MKNPITNQKGELSIILIGVSVILLAFSLAIHKAQDRKKQQIEKQEIVAEPRLIVQAENINKNWTLLHKGMNLDEVNTLVGPFPVNGIDAGRDSNIILKKDEYYVLTQEVKDKTERILKTRLTFKKDDILLLDSWSLEIELKTDR